MAFDFSDVIGSIKFKIGENMITIDRNPFVNHEETKEDRAQALDDERNVLLARLRAIKDEIDSL